MRCELAICSVLALLACDGGAKSADAPAAAGVVTNDGGAVPPEAKFAFERATGELAKIEAALAKGEVPRGTACAATNGYVKSLRALPSPSTEITGLVDNVDRVCEHEVPKATARAAIAKAKAARAANPDKNPLSECYSADFTRSLETLTKVADGDAEALQKEFDGVCPPRK